MQCFELVWRDHGHQIIQIFTLCKMVPNVQFRPSDWRGNRDQTDIFRILKRLVFYPEVKHWQYLIIFINSFAYLHILTTQYFVRSFITLCFCISVLFLLYTAWFNISLLNCVTSYHIICAERNQINGWFHFLLVN